MPDHFDLTLRELAEFIGIPERTLRLYQSKGLLDPPVRRGRVGRYNSSHVRQLRIVKALIARGFPLAEIARLNRAGSSRVALMLLLELPDDQTVGDTDSPDTRDGPLPPDTAHLVRERSPELLERLLALDILRSDDSGALVADGLGIAIVSDLLRAGMQMADIAEFIVAIGEVALAAEPALGAQLHPATPDPRLEALLVDAATVTFRETLSRARRR